MFNHVKKLKVTTAVAVMPLNWFMTSTSGVGSGSRWNRLYSVSALIIISDATKHSTEKHNNAFRREASLPKIITTASTKAKNTAIEQLSLLCAPVYCSLSIYASPQQVGIPYVIVNDVISRRAAGSIYHVSSLYCPSVKMLACAVTDLCHRTCERFDTAWSNL